MAPANSKQPADNAKTGDQTQADPKAPEAPAVPEQGQAPDGGEQSPEPARDEAEEERLLRELETSDVPATVKNVGRNTRRVGFAMVAPGEKHTLTERERESERMMRKVRHAVRTGFLEAAK